ncbi:hypothetical protein J6590_095538 [Homalodisca vitripennis]|nr:hypothetical protein J6590_095538 [Homalodisca vitripennis]
MHQLVLPMASLDTNTDEAVTEPRQLTVWRVGAGRPSTILFSPLMEPFQYPMFYPVKVALEIDTVIRAEIPSVEEAGGRLRKLVLQNMIHGLCGTGIRTDSPAGILRMVTALNISQSLPGRPHTLTTEATCNTDGNIKAQLRLNLLASTLHIIEYLFKYLMRGGSLQNVTVTSLEKQEDELEHYVTKRMTASTSSQLASVERKYVDSVGSPPTVESSTTYVSNYV